MRKILLAIAFGTVASFAIAQTATITPSGTVTICKGFGLLLAANTGTGYSYQWYWNDKVMNGQTTSQLTVTASGKYTVKISANNAEVTSEPTTINFVPPPRVSITYRDKSTDICTSGSIELKANKVSSVSYQWFKNWELLPGATQQSYTAAVAGSYFVQIIPDDKRCTVHSDSVKVTNSCAN
jgi:hypothetical protein